MGATKNVSNNQFIYLGWLQRNLVTRSGSSKTFEKPWCTQSWGWCFFLLFRLATLTKNQPIDLKAVWKHSLHVCLSEGRFVKCFMEKEHIVNKFVAPESVSLCYHSLFISLIRVLVTISQFPKAKHNAVATICKLLRTCNRSWRTIWKQCQFKTSHQDLILPHWNLAFQRKYLEGDF